MTEDEEGSRERRTEPGDMGARLAALEARAERAERERDTLREELAQLYDLMNSLDESFALLDGDDRVVFANRSWNALNEPVVHSARGTPFADIIRALSEARAVGAPGVGDGEWFLERMANHRQGDWGSLQKRADGRWYEVSEMMLGDGQHCLVAARDITRFQLAQEWLREGEERFQAFAESAAEWFWEMDENLCFSYLSPSIETSVGRPVAWHIGKSRADLLSSDMDPQVRAEHLAVLERREAFRDFVYPRENAGGGLSWVTISGVPMFDGEGRFRGYRGSGSDITARVEAERALAESEAQLSGIIEHLPAVVVVVALDGRILLANRAFAEWHGTTIEACVGAQAGDVMIEYRERGLDRQYQEVADSGTAQTFEYELLNSVGDRKYLLSVRYPLRNADGEVIAVGAVSTDVTRLKRAEARIALHRDALEAQVAVRTAELEASHAQLLQQERLATLGQLTSTVSHELRNPLSTINIDIRTLRARLTDADGALGGSLARVERNVQRCVRIIEELLHYGRRGDLSIEDVVVDDWLREAVADVKFPQGIALREAYGAGGVVRADPDRLRQALANVVNNAIQAVTELVETGHQQAVTVRSVRAGGRVILSVEDTGPGIVEAERTRVFEPLFSTKSFGFGLGLPLVKQILEQHGGGVDIAEAPGGGCRIDLWLPDTP